MWLTNISCTHQPLTLKLKFKLTRKSWLRYAVSTSTLPFKQTRVTNKLIKLKISASLSAARPPQVLAHPTWFRSVVLENPHGKQESAWQHSRRNTTPKTGRSFLGTKVHMWYVSIWDKASTSTLTLFSIKDSNCSTPVPEASCSHVFFNCFVFSSQIVFLCLCDCTYMID